MSLKISSVEEDVEQLLLSFTVGENIIARAALENIFTISGKLTVPYWSAFHWVCALEIPAHLHGDMKEEVNEAVK